MRAVAAHRPVCRHALVVSIPLLLACRLLTAQTIRTYAGGGAGDGLAATAVPLYEPFGGAFDPNGNFVFCERDGNRVRRVDTATGKISTIAGNGGKGFSGDGGPAAAAALNGPTGLAYDASGNLYVADAANARVRRVDAATGVITTFAGGGNPADFLGDGGPATAAALDTPWTVAFDASGDLYIGDLQAGRVRKVAMTTRVITTVAGSSTQGFAGDGGPATAAALDRPIGLAFDKAGNLYLADAGNSRVRKVDAATKTITTVAGNGSTDFGGDGGPGTAASLFYPAALLFDGSSHLIIADTFHRRVRSLDLSTGIITALVGNGDYGGGDGGPALQAGLVEPRGLARDAAGALYVTDFPIRKVAAGTSTISTYAGGGSSWGDGGPATSALLYLPGGIAVDPRSGDLLIAGYVDNRVRRVSAATKTIATAAGNGGLYFDSGGRAATDTPIGFPRSLAVDSAGNFFVGDPFNDLVYRVDAGSGILTVYAGGGPTDAIGDGQKATSAYVVAEALALDANGNLFIADRAHHRVRRVDAATQVITTVAGTDTTENGGGFSGDGGPATAARLSFPNGLAFDAAGDLYVAEYGNDCVRRITMRDGIIRTYAGRGNPPDGVGDGDIATAAFVRGPRQIAFDASGNLLIAESNRVRKVDHATTVITTLTGSAAGYLGDGGTPAAALLSGPWSVAVNTAGDVFVSDSENNRIRVVSTGGCPNPAITASPASQTIVSGQAAVLGVSAAGTGTLSYQWYQGASGDTSRPVAGATAASFTTPPLTATTSYWVRVQDSCGHADSAAATITVSTALADLTIQMSASADAIAVGSRVTFTVVARNNGPTTATGLTVTDTLPANATFVSVATSQGTCSGTGPVVCTAGSVVPGAAVTVTLVVAPQQTGFATNRARVDANEPDPYPNDDTAYYDVTVASASSADVYVWDSAAPDPVRTGQPLTYTLFVGNAGPAAATNVTLVDTLPANAAFSSVETRQGSCSGAGPVTCALGTLAPGGTTTVTLVLVPAAVGTVVNGVAVTHGEPDPVSWNDADQLTTNVLSSQAACPAPAPQILSWPSGIVRAGDTFTVSWSDVYGPTDPEGTYLAQLASSADFAPASVLDAVTTRNLDVSFPTQAGANGTYFFRVTSVAGCGTPGGASPPVTINVAPNPPAIVVTQPQTPEWIVLPNATPPPTTVRFKNIGGAPAPVQVRASADTPFFTFSPATALLAPGQELAVTVTALAGATAAVGTNYGALTADYVQGSVTESISLAVTDTFAEDGKATVDQDEVLIVERPAGARVPAADALPTVRITNSGKTPIFPVPSVGPGGAWLRLDPGDFAAALPPGETRTIKLATDPTRLTAADYPLPIWTVLTITAAGGFDPTEVKVFYTNSSSVVPATGRGFLPPGQQSFIVPTSVHKSGAGGTLFTSDGWIRNLSPDPASLDLYVTPSGEDGQSSAFKVQQSVPGFGTLRLFDFVQGLFGSTDLAGPVEVRSNDFSQLSVRVNASGLPGTGDITSRYGTEIPVYGSGAGTGVGLSSLVLTGIKSTSAYRLNVILAETIGTPARVTLRLYDSSGNVLASKLVNVPAAGNTQFPLLDTLGLGSSSVEAGSLVVEPAGGSGRVVAIGTLIDNASASFQSLSGRAFRGTTISGPRAAAASPAPRVIPSIVHSSGIGAYFTTEVSITNPTTTPAQLHLVYDYTGSVSGTATADVTLAAHASLPAAKSRDAVVNLFGLPAGSNTAGPMRIEGAGADLIVARATVTTPVDLNDASKGSKGSEFQSYSAASAEAVSDGKTPVAIYPGIQKYPGIRTNLILAEVSGQPATVRVRLVNGTSGGVIAQIDRTLAAWERVQINDIWNGAGGFAVGSASFDKVSVSLEPTGGAGAVVGALAVIDNVTNSSRILVLQPPGPPQPGWIGF